jgi:FkbM family methyltransferase
LNYKDKVEIRDIDILGETDWIWPKSDKGCFGNEKDGPMRDWVDSHQYKYFEHVKKFDLVVTAGAACGMYTRFYAKKFKTVIACEPEPLNFHCMVNNNQYDNVIKLNVALGEDTKFVSILRGIDNNVGTHKVTKNNLVDHTLMISIDSMKLEKCDLIQLDVEGYEKDAVMGALETIIKFRPVIVLENFRDIEFMSSRGYKKVSDSYIDSVFAYKG